MSRLEGPKMEQKAVEWTAYLMAASARTARQE
jgi:hypothetical protein